MQCYWKFNNTFLFYFLFFIFFKYFWRTHTHVLFWGHWYPCFGFLVTSPLGFKARAGCLIRIAEANVMYVPWDPPLVLHVADLLTVSIAGRRLGSYLAQGYYWHQWGSNPRSRDHEFYALTTRPRVPVYNTLLFGILHKKTEVPERCQNTWSKGGAKEWCLWSQQPPQHHSGTPLSPLSAPYRSGYIWVIRWAFNWPHILILPFVWRRAWLFFLRNTISTKNRTYGVFKIVE